MTEIAIRDTRRPVDYRRLIRAGAIPILVAVLAIGFAYFTVKKKCSGAFSHAFSNAFDVKHCDLVIRKNGGDVVLRARLPQWAEDIL